MAISSAARVGSIFLRCMHFRCRCRSSSCNHGRHHTAIIYGSCSNHGRHHTAIIHGSCRDHAETGAGLYHAAIMQLSCGEVDAAIMQEAGADGMPHRSRAGAKETWIQSRKPKPESRGLEGIPGYPHKESADHHPYNPPRKRYSPPLLLFYSLSQNFFLTKNSCSIITYTEVRDDK